MLALHFLTASSLVLWLPWAVMCSQIKIVSITTVNLCSRHTFAHWLAILLVLLLLVLFAHFVFWHMWNGRMLFRILGIPNSKPPNANSASQSPLQPEISAGISESFWSVGVILGPITVVSFSFPNCGFMHMVQCHSGWKYEKSFGGFWKKLSLLIKMGTGVFALWLIFLTI